MPLWSVVFLLKKTNKTKNTETETETKTLNTEAKKKMPWSTV